MKENKMNLKNRGTSYIRKLTNLEKQIEKKEKKLEKKLDPFLRRLKNNIITYLDSNHLDSFTAAGFIVTYNSEISYLMKITNEHNKEDIPFIYDELTDGFEIDFEKLESLKTFNEYLEGSIWTTIIKKEKYLKQLEKLEEEYSE